MFAVSLTAAFFVLGLILIARAVRGGFLSAFPLFYGYIIYLLISGVIVTVQYFWLPAHYPTGEWLRLILSFVAEFAVIVEISDHVFSHYPAIRGLGRFLTLCVCLAFFSFYILPPFLEPRSSSEVVIIELAKRSSLTKATMIIALLATVRYYRLPLDANVSGLLLGFSLYLATNVANCAILESLGWSSYGNTFGYVIPSAFTLALAVWTFALWRYQPALPKPGSNREGAERVSDRLSDQLGRVNTALIRVLGK